MKDLTISGHALYCDFVDEIVIHEMKDVYEINRDPYDYDIEYRNKIANAARVILKHYLTATDFNNYMASLDKGE